MLKLSEEDSRLLGSLFQPSWLSGLVAIAVGLLVSVGVIIAFSAHNSQVQQQLLAWQQNQAQPTLTAPGQNLPENDHPTIQGSWTLLILWGFVGFLAYVLVAAVIHFITKAEEIKESLNYVHAQRRDILATTTEHVLLRLVAAILFIISMSVVYKLIIPYSIAAATPVACISWVLPVFWMLCYRLG